MYCTSAVKSYTDRVSERASLPACLPLWPGKAWALCTAGELSPAALTVLNKHAALFVSVSPVCAPLDIYKTCRLCCLLSVQVSVVPSGVCVWLESKLCSETLQCSSGRSLLYCHWAQSSICVRQVKVCSLLSLQRKLNYCIKANGQIAVRSSCFLLVCAVCK